MFPSRFYLNWFTSWYFHLWYDWIKIIQWSQVCVHVYSDTLCSCNPDAIFILKVLQCRKLKEPDLAVVVLQWCYRCYRFFLFLTVNMASNSQHKDLLLCWSLVLPHLCLFFLFLRQQHFQSVSSAASLQTGENRLNFLHFFMEILDLQ